MNDSQRQRIIEMLQRSYNMELETVANYLANSVYLDGIYAKHVRESLASDVTEELGHAQRLANRIKILDGRIPGSMELTMAQKNLQPPEDALDVLAVIRGVIEAEQNAIDQYQKIIEETNEGDLVTQELCIELKGDEEEHKREFVGFLREAERMHMWKSEEVPQTAGKTHRR